MADRPILFSAPMVLALIAGTKTQTRRALKPQPHLMSYKGLSYIGVDGKGHKPRIAAGDRLWVRESITRFDKGSCDQHVWYRAGANTEAYHQGYLAREAGSPDGSWPHAEGPAGGAPYSVPSIFMPKWASRLTLTVTDVQVERLQDISAEDAIAEGTPCYVCGGAMTGRSEDDCHCFHRKADASDYRILWEMINGPGSWDANPWIAAYSFTVHYGNIDQIGSAS